MSARFMNCISCVTVVLIFNTKLSYGATPELDASLRHTTEELIQSQGFDPETYYVVTRDGYILHLVRVNNSTGLPVLVQHGMSGSSDYFVLNDRKKDLVYLLQDAGFDVWLGDCRGNHYSQRHLNLSRSKLEFWDFSLHEMGIYDIPAFIDYVLMVTGYPQLSLIGHSMGATAFLITGSERQHYMPKINMFVGFAPAAIPDRSTYSKERKIFINVATQLVEAARFLNLTNILPHFDWAPYLAAICSINSKMQDLCHDALFFWAGYEGKRMPRKQFARILAHVPAGMSSKAPAHYLQFYQSGHFRHFDYGLKENVRRYNATEPPDYDLKKVSCPSILYYSWGDFLVNASEGRLTRSQFPRLVKYIELDTYNHIDFIWSKSAKKDIFLDLIETLKKELGFETP